MLKKWAVCLLAAMILGAAFSGCADAPGGAGSSASGQAAEPQYSVVCTIFPQYDWVRNILGGEVENVELTLLLDDGADLHNYQPTVSDIALIGSCDLFIYVGGESDAWLEDVLTEATNPGMRTLALMETVEAKEEAVVEGMEEGEDHAAGGESAGEEPEYDEHVWLSLRLAQRLVTAIAQTLGELDPNGAEAYAKNAAGYNAGLAALDGEYEKAVSEAKYDTVVFGDRFPFRYLMDDCGLQYYAAFPGCSAETEASFRTVVFLAGKLDELGLPAVLVIDGSDGKIARTVVENTRGQNQAVLTLNACQTVTAAQIEAGATYLDIMRGNLERLKQALN